MTVNLSTVGKKTKKGVIKFIQEWACTQTVPVTIALELYRAC